jgi:ubiquinone/menaquinone biosynthesis C-methylase UbiE
MNRAHKRKLAKLAWLSAAVGSAAAAATVLGVRYYRRKLDTEATRLSEVLNLVPGMTVVEVGAGKGGMSIRIARRVLPGGRVLSTEFEPKKLLRIHSSVHKSGLNNIVAMQGNKSGAELWPECYDAIYMRTVYHHFTAPDEMNRSLFRALRPGGILAVIDFPPRLLLSLCTPKGIPDNRGGHGIRKELVIQELGQVGFQPVREYHDWPFGLYCVVFRKPGQAKPLCETLQQSPEDSA